jgi:hypothetical protein
MPTIKNPSENREALGCPRRTVDQSVGAFDVALAGLHPQSSKFRRDGNMSPTPDVRAVAKALADRAEDVAAALLGEPSRKARHEWRWGRHGSLSLRISGTKRGSWFDHERGDGGDLLHLISRERNVRLSEAITIAAQEFVGASTVPHICIMRRPPPVQFDGSEARVKAALRMWSESEPIGATLAERYFVEHRRLHVTHLDLSHALRWHGSIRAIIALMTNAVSGERCGVHRTYLDDDGIKVDRKMLGRQGVVRLSPEVTVAGGLGISEGVEDGLAVLLSGWAPLWAGTSAGAIARFPVLAGIETLTIFADADACGIKGAEKCRARWIGAGREAVISPPIGNSHA